MIGRLFGLWVALGMALCGCVERNTVGGHEEFVHPSIDAGIEVPETLLAFGNTVSPDWRVMTVPVRSVGTDDLHLTSLIIEGSSSFAVLDDDAVHVIAPGDETLVEVRFLPLADGDFQGVLHIASDDLANPDVTVDLDGSGLAPRIELDPPSWDFGEPVAGCVQDQTITIRNVGSSILTIQDIDFSATSDELQHTYLFGLDLELVPGAMEQVTVAYEAHDEMADTGYLYVTSDDPSRPEAMAVQHGTGQLTEEVVDEYIQDGTNWTDILWVVDNSCSMSDDQNSLATNFSTFFDVIDMQDMDYHLGVVTTDDSLLQGPFPIMTPSTPDVHAAFAAAVTVGTMGSGNEKGFQYSWGALSPPLTDPGGPNDDFLREDAGLHIIYVSDEAEQSSGTVTDYVNNFLSLKIDPDDVMITCIVQQNYGQRYEQAATMTGGLVEYMSVPDWMNTLTQLAWLSNSLEDRFELSQVAVDGTVAVEINDVPVYAGWYFDEIYNAVVFEPGHVPGVDDRIALYYHPIGGPGECP